MMFGDLAQMDLAFPDRLPLIPESVLRQYKGAAPPAIEPEIQWLRRPAQAISNRLAATPRRQRQLTVS
jgi:hypothetical protein